KRSPRGRGGEREMDQKRVSLIIVIWLISATTFLAWFDYAAATAIFFPQHDQMGYLRFQVLGYGNTPYPFTYAAAGLSVLGVAYGIYRQENSSMRRWYALFLGLG